MGKRRHRHGDDDSIDEDEVDKHKDDKSKKKRRRRHHSESETESESSSYSSSEDEYRRRKRRDKEKKRRKKKEKEEQKKKKKKKVVKEKKKVKGAVTDSWGKYGIIKEIDMWNKRPEFSAWLQEVKELTGLLASFLLNKAHLWQKILHYVVEWQVNLETVPTWEEKQMFKEYMEDYNTATFPSKKYYDLDAYHHRQMIKEMEKGVRKAMQKERTVFNDEDERRQEIRMEREKQKEAEAEAMQLSMQTGKAKAMKEQAQLREEMNYQYKLGNYEAAAAIQKRLDPDAPA